MTEYNNFLKQKIAKCIVPKSKVLDLGCGNGNLLNFLIEKKQINGYGIDLDFNNIVNCIKEKIPAFQGNIEDCLTAFGDNSYDTVILSQTLQETKNPVKVLQELLRIGKKGIVTFPNFGYWQTRLQLLAGSPPVTKTLPYEWYNTPNIRIITIKAFRKLCKEQNISIIKEIPIFNHSILTTIIPKNLSNLVCKRGIFIIQKNITN
ncbi:methionine biosynthesis protein MetW [Candidatus Marinamargulisbacteria bacterium SCGC AG-410-N11]|nr:methionine biosynthesis protein MetW [Candidatus Marinamargulisbacteria bacterium SCGC AG-410-N11]